MWRPSKARRGRGSKIETAYLKKERKKERRTGDTTTDTDPRPVPRAQGMGLGAHGTAHPLSV